MLRKWLIEALGGYVEVPVLEGMRELRVREDAVAVRERVAAAEESAVAAKMARQAEDYKGRIEELEALVDWWKNKVSDLREEAYEECDKEIAKAVKEYASFCCGTFHRFWGEDGCGFTPLWDVDPRLSSLCYGHYRGEFNANVIGLVYLEHYTLLTKKQAQKVCGIGPKTVEKIGAALQERGLSFKSE